MRLMLGKETFPFWMNANLFIKYKSIGNNVFKNYLGENDFVYSY